MKVKLKPSNNKLKVFNPKNNRHLSNNGELVNLSIYWRRLLKSGDVVKVVEPKKEKKVARSEKQNLENKQKNSSEE